MSDFFEKARQAPAYLNALWRLRGCTRVGSRPRVYGNPRLLNLGEIYIGERFIYFSHTAQSEMVAYESGRIEIGDRVFINYGTSISAHKSVVIGDRCQIASHVQILDCDYHGVENRDEVPEPRPVTLGANVWIGIRAILLPGVTIGGNSVVGAGSVVTCDLPPNCLAAGVPAKVIRSFTPRGEAATRPPKP